MKDFNWCWRRDILGYGFVRHFVLYMIKVRDGIRGVNKGYILCKGYDNDNLNLYKLIYKEKCVVCLGHAYFSYVVYLLLYLTLNLLYNYCILNIII